MIDVGGTNVKMMVSGKRERRKFRSHRAMTAAEMVAGVLQHTEDWGFDVVSVGFPGLLKKGEVTRNPLNLGGEWERFDFERAFKCPVRLMNDAAMQALASYQTGRFLFVGLGTSVGASLIADDVIVPIEIGLLRLTKNARFMDRLCNAEFQANRPRWQRSVERAMAILRDMFWPDHILLGGGNSKYLDPVPDGCEIGKNADAFRGATRLWEGYDMLAVPHETTWRIERPSANGAPPKKKRASRNSRK